MEYKDKSTFTEEPSLYPKVPSAPPVLLEELSFRLKKINDIQRILEQERDARQSLTKKYRKVSSGLSHADTILLTVSLGLGAAGVGLLSTIVAAPYVIMIEATALGTGLLSIVGKQINKRMIRKAEKHERIKTIAEAKLNTINDLISKALNDNHVSQEEFTLISEELTKYRQMKEEVRAKTKQAIDEETRSSLINQGRNEALDSFHKMFSKNQASFRKLFSANEAKNNEIE